MRLGHCYIKYFFKTGGGEVIGLLADIRALLMDTTFPLPRPSSFPRKESWRVYSSSGSHVKRVAIIVRCVLKSGQPSRLVGRNMLMSRSVLA